jgi:type IV secretory pathway VirD2 relaxase
VEPDGRPGVPYGPVGQPADPRAFLERARTDPAQARIMLSPDDASELPDLRDVTRDVMTGLAAQLEGELDWVAVDHANTGRLHAHVVLRGRDTRGRPLHWDARTLHREVRGRAMAALVRELGPDSDRALRERLRAEARSQQLTGLDLGLVEQARGHAVDLRARPPGREERLARARAIDRVRTLSRMGLAREFAPLQWQLASHVLPTLQAMGRRRETYRLLERVLANAGLHRPVRDRSIAGDGVPWTPVVGALLDHGCRTGAAASLYVVVDATDGRVWYADVTHLPGGIRRGAIVELAAAYPGLAAVDRGIEAEAAARNGIWKAGRYGREAADRRIRALARAGLATPDGTDRWRLAGGIVERIRAAGLARQYRELRVQVLEPWSLDRQQVHPGTTWLDPPRRVGPSVPLANRGFGMVVKRAYDERRARPDPGTPDDHAARRGRGPHRDRSRRRAVRAPGKERDLGR